MIKNILIIILICLIIPVYAVADDGFYIQGGIAFHSMPMDCPEYCGTNPLMDFGAGYTIDLGEWTVDIYFEHRSSLFDYEDGYGHNLLGLGFRKYFKER